MQKTISAPPSKSISHRALICAALARGESIVKNLLISDDTLCTARCLNKLGTTFFNTSSGDIIALSKNTIPRDLSSIKVSGIPDKNFSDKKKTLDMDVGESGTTCRLITPIVAAFNNIQVRIYGKGRMHKRPIGDLKMALERLGTRFIWDAEPGFPPYIIQARGLKGGRVQISIEKSSQYLSGLLLASPLAQGPIEIELIGKKAVSWPYVGLTLQTMEAFGVNVEIYTLDQGSWVQREIKEIKYAIPGEIKFKIKPSKYTPSDFFVEGDWSNGSYLISAGLLLKNGLRITGLKKDSLQGDKRVIQILRQMGGKIYWEKEDIVSTYSELKGIDIDMGDCPDLVPTIAVMASMASGTTRISGVAHLRLKESNRLEGVAREISKIGARVNTFDHGLVIEPQPIPKGKTIEFSTYGDHRMAMGLSLYELAGINVVLDNKGCVTKSFPDFFQVWQTIINS